MSNVIPFKVIVQEEDECIWIESVYSTWRTSCGETIEDMELTPEEGGLHFCAYCGKRLVQELHPDRHND